MTDERDVEASLRKKVEELGGLCIKLPGVVKRGIPDRICLFPGGYAVLVELKTTTGRLSAAQKLQQTKLSRMGYDVYTLWTKDAVAAFIRDVEQRNKKA